MLYRKGELSNCANVKIWGVGFGEGADDLPAQDALAEPHEWVYGLSSALFFNSPNMPIKCDRRDAV
ncbi:hypothetical protein [Alteromonas stellipolaris]|uniref:hypothetical protein n=1 Tax=Alteromonas stellipolaris TaxID=233316 RepID=UPI0026E3DEE0|nr:hypothetical protein [Alteromonas stellipolaris]MDO6535706.1 hypothetical protein [Alteromonas stellipolaris]MDO6625704.1 hypothetical protein [Alteromonas stellipolaris]